MIGSSHEKAEKNRQKRAERKRLVDNLQRLFDHEGYVPAGFYADIINADCREILPLLTPEHFALAITDPPYFLDGLDDGWDDAAITKKKKGGVVGGLPVGMKFDKDQGKKLYDFLLPVFKEVYRVLRPGAFFLVFSSPRLSHRMGVALEDAGFEIRDMLLWRYRNGGQEKAFGIDHLIDKHFEKLDKEHRKKPGPDKEYYSRPDAVWPMMSLRSQNRKKWKKEADGWKTPQLRPQFEPIFLAKKPSEEGLAATWILNQTGLMNFSICHYGEKGTIIDGHPTTIFTQEKPSKEERLGHPTQKPVELIRRLIALFHPKGEYSYILDPFAGSGTVLAAASADQKKSLGIERDTTYCNMIIERLSGEEERLYGTRVKEGLVKLLYRMEDR